ncbi:hypothetical protein FRC06_004970 [Ceratobasidium sp. 370]|nr:hypothetical protein FRC06_004970 [Ceratobasidium sp. 370]
MARKKQTESASQPLTKWFSSQRSAPSSSPVVATSRHGARTGATAEAELVRKRHSGKAGALGPTVSFASTLTPLSSPAPSPVRRSDRIRTSVTPAPTPPRRPRVYQLQPVARMPDGIRCPSPLDDSPTDYPRRFSPPPWMKSVPDEYSSDTEEIPSSQKDDDEPMPEDDLATLEAIPVYHVSSPPTSPSSQGLITPAPATPPRLLSPDSKARHIIEEIRAKARLVVSSTSPPLKRPLSPSDDSDSDGLPEAGFLLGTAAPPAKRHASINLSPNLPRRSTRKSDPSKAIRVAVRSTAPPRPKPGRNPFAALVREHAARAKRSESLPLAPDGSRQDLLAIADAALMRDVDASFEEPTAESSQFVDADEALDQLAEGGFAAEAELVRRAGTTPAEPNWTMFGLEGDAETGILAAFPDTVAGFMQTQFAKKVWGRVASWVKTQDYFALSNFLGSATLSLAFASSQEQVASEPVTKWLIELVFLSPARLSLAEGAARDACSLANQLPSDAQDRIAAHVAQCLLRIGPPGNGVQTARQILGNLGETTHVASAKEHRWRLVRLCASILGSLTRAKDVFPLLTILCLIGIDPSLDSPTRLKISKATEEWVCKANDAQAQLTVCRALVETLGALPVQQKRDIVRHVFRGTRPATGHMSMWLATASLDNQGMDAVTPAIYAQRPPLKRILEHVETLHITSSTHYPDLLATVQLLDIALWDVGALVDAERRAGRVVKYQPGVPPDSMVTEVVYKLMEMHGRIVDVRATDLEKTRTKGVLQTLQIRLGWDLMEAARRGQQASTTIREMWGKPRPSQKQL